jgi:hypothetical protein
VATSRAYNTNSDGTYWIAVRDKASTGNVLARSINVSCATTTTTSTSTSTSTSTTTEPPTTTTSTSTSTSTTTTTTAAYYSFSLGVDSISGNGACIDYASAPITYHAAVSVLANTVTLYQDSALSTFAPDNYYSDGTNSWFITGGNGVLTSQTACTGATSSTTTTTTTEPPTTTTTSTSTTSTTSTTTSGGGGGTTTSTSTTTSSPIVDIFVGNVGSLDIPIGGMTINGVAVTWVGYGPDFYINSGDNGSFTSTQIGTYDVVISYGSHTPGQRISFTDSASVVTCQTLSGSGGTFTITNATITGGTTITVEALDGICP